MVFAKRKNGIFNKKIINYFYHLRAKNTLYIFLWKILGFCSKIRQTPNFLSTKHHIFTIDTTAKNKYVLQFADNQLKDPITAYEQRMNSVWKVPLKYLTLS